MMQDFQVTLNGTIATDPSTNDVLLSFKGFDRAQVDAFTKWLTDWIPINQPGPTPPAHPPTAIPVKR